MSARLCDVPGCVRSPDPLHQLSSVGLSSLRSLLPVPKRAVSLQNTVRLLVAHLPHVVVVMLLLLVVRRAELVPEQRSLEDALRVQVLGIMVTLRTLCEGRG